MKLMATYETEVYVSDNDYIVVKQIDPMGGDDSTVLLSPEQAERVGQELIRLAASMSDQPWGEASEAHSASPKA